MSNTLYISGFHVKTRARDLALVLEKYGQLRDLELPVPKRPMNGGPLQPIAFAVFRDSQVASLVIRKLDNTMFNNHRIHVAYAKGRHSRDGLARHINDGHLSSRHSTVMEKNVRSQIENSGGKELLNQTPYQEETTPVRHTRTFHSQNKYGYHRDSPYIMPVSRLQHQKRQFFHCRNNKGNNVRDEVNHGLQCDNEDIYVNCRQDNRSRSRSPSIRSRSRSPSIRSCSRSPSIRSRSRSPSVRSRSRSPSIRSRSRSPSIRSRSRSPSVRSRSRSPSVHSRSRSPSVHSRSRSPSVRSRSRSSSCSHYVDAINHNENLGNNVYRSDGEEYEEGELYEVRPEGNVKVDEEEQAKMIHQNGHGMDDEVDYGEEYVDAKDIECKRNTDEDVMTTESHAMEEKEGKHNVISFEDLDVEELDFDVDM